MNREVLYSEVKRAFPKLDNKAVHAFTGGLWSLILKWHKTAMREAEASIKAEWEKAKVASSMPSGKRMSEEELADAIDNLLCTKVADQTISAAEIAQLSSIRNLKKTDRDIVIQVVNYKEVSD